MPGFAVVTGASSGIGLELAKCCAKDGYDVLLAADRPLDEAESELRQLGVNVETVVTDLATEEGVDELMTRIEGRNVDLLFANAGEGLGHGFLGQDWNRIRHMIDTNVTGTMYLTHHVARKMLERRAGKILFTGSIAGFMPGTFQAVYNGTKAFIDSFAIALRHELEDSGVSVTVLMPGPTETEFFARADMLDTKVAQDEKDDPADVARVGYKALMDGDDQVVAGWKNKLQVAAAHITPAGVLAERHRKMAEPGSTED